MIYEILRFAPRDEVTGVQSVTVDGWSKSSRRVVEINRDYVALFVPSGHVYSGIGRPQSYAPTRFEVWEFFAEGVPDGSFERDVSIEQAVRARRCIAFNKSA